MTLAPGRVWTKVSRTSPVAVPAGTPVTTVAVLVNLAVVAVPTWVMSAVVVTAVVFVVSEGMAFMTAPTPIMPIDATRMLCHKRESTG